LALAAGLGATSLAACSADKTDPSTTQAAAALSANEPAKGDHGFKGRGPDGLFARWDKDGDGKVALGDLPEKMKSRLAEADKNHDGVLTRDELAQAHQAKRAERFAQADKNHDGALSADEMPAERWQHIQAADANQDGKVTAAELDAAMAAGKIKPPPRHHGNHGAGPAD
jgi:Ca2+-binding EF-hand superfamily protein